MKGGDVRTLQRDLSASGFQTSATGLFTLATRTAVIQFQKHYHLANDGVVGNATFHKLFAVLKAAANQPDISDTAVVSEGGTGLAPVSIASTKPTLPTMAGGTATTASAEPLPVEDSGGAAFVPPPDDAPVVSLTVTDDGLGQAPSVVPSTIQNIIDGANAIAFTPYVYGGGHGSFDSAGYDCSGSVSYALHAGGLLKTPLDSTQFESYGDAGPGRWITLYANSAHVYMKIGNVWYDTAAQSAANGNDRWSTTRISPSSGFVVRHPAGW